MEQAFLGFMGLMLIYALLFVLAYPYRLHFASRRLGKPLVEFSARIWRVSLFTLWLNGALIFLITLLILFAFQTGRGAIVLLLMAQPAVWVVGITIRLHVSYWQQDEQAILLVNTLEKQATYSNQDGSLEFVFSDVTRVVKHSCKFYRVPWKDYEYQVFHLKDGSEIRMTCLFYSILGPDTFFSNTPRELKQHRVCWLPKRN